MDILLIDTNKKITIVKYPLQIAIRKIEIRNINSN